MQNVKINGEPIDLNKTYTLATNDFTAVGGDGYDMFKSATKLGEYSALDEALVSYIKQLPNGIVGEEYASEQGRITIYSSAEEVGGDKEEDDTTQDGVEEDTEEDDTTQGGVEEDTEEDDTTQDGVQEDTENIDGTEDEVEESPKTGDENIISAYAVMFVISISVLGTVIVSRKKVVNK